MAMTQRRNDRGAVSISALRWLACVIALLVVGSASGCNSGDSDSTTEKGPPVKGGALDIATPLEPVSLDPQAGQTDAGSQHAQDLIFDRLVEVRPGSTDIVPGLADSWELSADRRSMTFDLRNAEFSDGTPVTSRDVKFSLDRAQDPKLDVNFATALQDQWSSISTPDAQTVVFHFDGPSPAILSWLSFMPCSIISKAAFDKAGGDQKFARAPVDAGTGPFELVKWVRGQRVELKRNRSYWRKDFPYVNAVKLLYIPDDNTRMLKVRSGEVDIADDVPYSQIDSVDSVDGVAVKTTKVAAQYGPWLSSSGQLKDLAVRQALNYATPKKTIVDVALAGRGEIANSFIPPMKYWDPDIPPYPDDIEKAKELMAGSSVPDGFDLDLYIQSGDAVSRQTAQILQDAWGKIGVNLKVQALEQGTFYEHINSGDFSVVLAPPTAASSDIPSEDEFAVNLVQPAFEGIFSHHDPKLSELVKQIEGTWDEDERKSLFSEYQRRQLENPIGIPIATASARTAVRDNVAGFDYVLMNWFYLDETSIH